MAWRTGFILSPENCLPGWALNTIWYIVAAQGAGTYWRLGLLWIVGTSLPDMPQTRSSSPLRSWMSAAFQSALYLMVAPSGYGSGFPSAPCFQYPSNFW